MDSIPILWGSVKYLRRRETSRLNTNAFDFKARHGDWSVNFIPVGILVHEFNTVAHRSDEQYRAVVKVAACSSDQKEFPLLDFYEFPHDNDDNDGLG